MSQDDEDDKPKKADEAKGDKAKPDEAKKPDKVEKDDKTAKPDKARASAKTDTPDEDDTDKKGDKAKATADKANKDDPVAKADKDDPVAKAAKADQADKDKVANVAKADEADKAGKVDKPVPADDDDDEDDDIEDLKRRYLLKRFWESASGFWRGNARRVSWFLTGSLLATIAVQLVIQYQLTVWNRVIFDALENKNADTVLFQAMIFPVLAVASVLSWVVLVYLRMTTQRRWRRWLTSHVIDRWLGSGRYYQLNLVKGDHQNPEYRIAEDLRLATESPVEFVVGIVSASLSAMTFIVVLWTIGGALTVPIGGTTITIPGFLVVGAVVYAIIASGSMLLIGRRFVRVAENKNQAEAEYRYILTRLRENGESIALIRGEPEERAGLEASITNVLRRWRDVCFQTMRTTIVYQGSGILAPVVPVILSAPKFLDGSMTLGQVMQAASAFVIVQQAFSWLVDNYPRFADWTASARRVASLMVSLDTLDRAEEAGVGHIDYGETNDAALHLSDLSVTLDDGTVVVNDADVAIEPGEKVLVVGESGTGKSSLVRAIAGLWPWGGGKLELQAGARLFMLPQRPYIPIGTLRRAVTYPSGVDDVPAEEVAEAMEQVGLGDFIERLDEEANWDQILSGGEKQRVAFARILVHKPDIIVMDEATSALDPGSQEYLMNLIQEKLPKTTIISVGHRPELEKFHERKLVLEARKEGAKLARDIDISKVRHRRRWRWPRRRRRGQAAKERAKKAA
jgi:putative ATP-binding cassette transporter